MFYVHVLHSTKDNGFYIGYSTDLKMRDKERQVQLIFAFSLRLLFALDLRLARHA